MSEYSFIAGAPFLLFIASEVLACTKKYESNSIFELVKCVFCLKRDTIIDVNTDNIGTESGGNIKIITVEAHTPGTKV